MLRYIDINYGVHKKPATIKSIIDRYHASFCYLQYLKDSVHAEAILHHQEDGQYSENGIVYTAFRGESSFFFNPRKTHKYIKQYQADVVLVQGLVFPLQVIFLRWQVGKRCKIIAQHHGEQPFKNRVKRLLQRWADKHTDAYLFTALENAEIWIKKGIISKSNKCHEVLEASTHFTRVDKEVSKKKTGIGGNNSFLWVGRLDANKDPLTVLRAFDDYLREQQAHLYMIYQTEDMLHEVIDFINNSDTLQQHVTLVGKVKHHELPYWYSAANFYVSASHREGSGYALIEAMACGCIPIVTAIPSFKMITANGTLGLLYNAGDSKDLLRALKQSQAMNEPAATTKILQHFREKLAFAAIAEGIHEVCRKITST